MLKFFYAGSIRIPSYGMMIIVGVIVCNLIAQQSLRKNLKQYKEFMLIEIVGGIGAVICAKLMTILNSPSNDLLSVGSFMDAGYSYYGGLFGFFSFAYLICKVFRIDGTVYAKEYIYLLPLLHTFWKVGCYLGGCCYGRLYNGALAICYPDGVNDVAGKMFFPSPLFEAIVAGGITIILFYVKRRKSPLNPVGIYLVLYGLTRFVLEFCRYHEYQSFFSVAHVYSIIATGSGIVLVIISNRKSGYERARTENN